MPETVSCPCGSAKPASRTIQARDADSGEAFTYLTCPDCTLERLSPLPTAAEMGAYYPQSYAPHVGAPPFGRADRLKRLIYDVFWAPDIAVPAAVRRIRPLLRLALAPVRHRSVLAFAAPGAHRVFEFGAAKATDLLAFRAAGWEVAGCEPSAQACALAASQGDTCNRPRPKPRSYPMAPMAASFSTTCSSMCTIRLPCWRSAGARWSRTVSLY